jgi:siroheme synthase-like protein
VAETPRRHLPISLNVDRRLAVVVGEGRAAEKRARQLVRYGADVVVVTPAPSEDLLEAEAAGQLTIEQRSYVRGDLSGARVAFCVTDDEEVRRAVFEEAESSGCLVNVSGEPRYSNFIVPSVINRDPLQLAISTGGIAPELSKQLRKQLEAEVGVLWPSWITLVAETRALAGERLPDPDEQRAVMELATGEWTRRSLDNGVETTPEQVIEEALLRQSHQ